MKAKINGGATIWARQIIDSDIFYNKPDKWFKIWFYLINKVNHKDNKQFARGSCFMKYEWIMEKTKATKNEVGHCIKWLKSATMIATRKATGGFIVKVLNYNAFQSLDNYKSDSKSDSNGNTKAIQKRYRSDNIHNNGKNGNNDNNKDKEVVNQSFQDLKEKKKANNIEYDFETQCWYGLDDDILDIWGKKFPMLNIAFELQDKLRGKFRLKPKYYEKLIKEKYKNNFAIFIFDWLEGSKKFYLQDHPEYEQSIGRNVSHIGKVIKNLNIIKDEGANK